jgi:hypothetical protein
MHPPIHHPCPQCLSKTYLKVTVHTVAPSGQFPHHLPMSSDRDGLGILTYITGDLAVFTPTVGMHTSLSEHNTASPQNTTKSSISSQGACGVSPN